MICGYCPLLGNGRTWQYSAVGHDFVSEVQGLRKCDIETGIWDCVVRLRFSGLRLEGLGYRLFGMD